MALSASATRCGVRSTRRARRFMRICITSSRRGFSEAPRFLGIDGREREVLTYIEGEIGGRPLHQWAGREDVLVAIARFQRRLHDCSFGFTLPAGAEWR